MVTQAIVNMRTRAGLARRLSEETKDPAAKANLLQIAAMLDADADRLEAEAQLPSARAADND